jgi:hypothetical protein
MNLIKKKLKKKVKYTFKKGLMKFSSSNANNVLKSLVIPQVLQITLYFSSKTKRLQNNKTNVYNFIIQNNKIIIVPITVPITKNR